MNDTRKPPAPVFLVGAGWWDEGYYIAPIFKIGWDGAGEATGLATRDGRGLNGVEIAQRSAAIREARTLDDLRALPYVVDRPARPARR